MRLPLRPALRCMAAPPAQFSNFMQAVLPPSHLLYGQRPPHRRPPLSTSRPAPPRSRASPPTLTPPTCAPHLILRLQKDAPLLLIRARPDRTRPRPLPSARRARADQPSFCARPCSESIHAPSLISTLPLPSVRTAHLALVGLPSIYRPSRPLQHQPPFSTNRTHTQHLSLLLSSGARGARPPTVRRPYRQ